MIYGNFNLQRLIFLKEFLLKINMKSKTFISIVLILLNLVFLIAWMILKDNNIFHWIAFLILPVLLALLIHNIVPGFILSLVFVKSSLKQIFISLAFLASSFFMYEMHTTTRSMSLLGPIYVLYKYTYPQLLLASTLYLLFCILIRLKKIVT